MIIELGLWPDQDRQINRLRPAEVLAKDSGKNCIKCGRPIAMSSGITINGAACHARCWHYGGMPVPKAPPATRPEQAHPSEGDHYARPRVMPAVEPLQLGNTRAA